MAKLDPRTNAEVIIDLAEIWATAVPEPMPEWLRHLIRQMFPEPGEPDSCQPDFRRRV